MSKEGNKMKSGKLQVFAALVAGLSLCDHGADITVDFDSPTGKIKPVSKQLAANPKAELCAFKDGVWLRVACELVEDDRIEAKKSMLDDYSTLRAMYDENDGNTQVLYLKNAVATFSSFTAPAETYSF